MIYKRVAQALIFLFFIHFSIVAAFGYKPWAEEVFTHIKQEYGDKAEERARYLHDIILKNQDKPVDEKLKLVNDTLNHLPWIADRQHWEQADYWATPLETITTFGGDCEDIAIAKWMMLRHLGIAKDNLRLAYVKIKESGEAHMVLLYLKNLDKPESERYSLVLDNYVDEIKKGTDRTDVFAVYAISADGEMTVFADNGKDRSIKGVVKERKVRKLSEVQSKMLKERELFTKLNGGYHPLEN